MPYADVAPLVRAPCWRLNTASRKVDGSIPSVSTMNYRIYKKRPGVPKCLSELGDDGKPLHKFTYFKTWREACHWLRSKHRGGVFETKCQFTCEVSNA